MGYNKGTRQISATGIEGGNPLSPVQVIAPPCTTALAVPHTQYNATWLIYQGALYKLCKAHSKTSVRAWVSLYLCALFLSRRWTPMGRQARPAPLGWKLLRR